MCISAYGRMHARIRNKYRMRINEDYMDVIDRDEIINSDLSMNIKDNVVWLLNGQPTNIEFNLINKPIYKV